MTQPTPPPAPPAPPRVLIADDQPDVVRALQLLLKTEGFETESAASPAQALAALARRPFDAALIDLNYARDTTSGREGLDLLARIGALDATLLLNDFDMSAAYECLIEGVLEAGIKIDALGLQSHMHQGYWGVEKTLAVLGRFARYGLPLHFTETNIVSGHLMPPDIVDLNDYQVDDWPTTPQGEARQAEETVLHYKTLLAHPSVEAITWWDFSDGGWLKAPAGLVRIDG